MKKIVKTWLKKNKKLLIILGFGIIITILFLIIKYNVPFETVSKGYYSGYVARNALIIQNESMWNETWNILASTSYVAENGTIVHPSAPIINFDNYTIIAVFQGEFSTGGASIEITKITEEFSNIKVYIQESRPSLGEITTMAFSQPYHIVKILKTNKEILFMNFN